MTEQNIARASAWMALGTIVSRLTGFLRLLLLFAVIGKSLNADIFNNANTIPNALYILVAGGIFNVVLVPQLVRAMKNDEDGGDAYANRVITLGLLVVASATAILVVAVPWLVRLFFNARLFTPAFDQQRESLELLAYLCMPQVFFYGSFVLIGQVLNARSRFGPMMWAPIVNNVVACAMLVSYAIAFGTSDGREGFSAVQSLLLGIGSTLAIATQTAVLVPFLRQAGFHFRPRFDFRGVGLSHTLRLGMWTLMFVAVNQVAFTIVQRLGTGATTAAASTGEDAGGSAVYEFGFLVSQMPHGVITVSLATAIIPTLSALAAERRYDRFRLELGRTLRIALVIVVPLAVVGGCLGQQAATVAGLVGSLNGNTQVIGYTIQAFALAMVAFTVHYLMLRGFYANEDTRTPFFIQSVIAVVNIATAIVLTSQVGPSRVAMMLALSYGISYVVGAVLSVLLLSRVVGPVLDREMLIFTGRLVVCASLAAFVMLGVALGLDAAGVDQARPLGGLLSAAGAAAAGGLTYVAAAKVVHMDQLTYLLRTVLRRS
ncbi:murein biosynthesis integral membrane protein MurJ [Aeromicrobium sp.]|uniref:murein biosynthesis integral membrane protein MurJ n=1 Tax=Aeromicrobium sp. TaxID=1871063 RepID=UPI0019C2DCBF|nr:murein biosynthesis integral membrane protein MurJ [Aeromicrobium sp.]MBC7633009.1 murein biosynthesis integral membrane protein MurJ [Aeromicrobium sp.]